MIMWLALGGLLLIALIFVVRPLFRIPEASVGSTAYELEVFEDQLKELDRDFERGVIDSSEVEAARVEIQRRMLAASEKNSPVANSGAPAKPIIWCVTIAVPLFAGVIYLALGRPDLTHRPAHIALGPSVEDVRNAARLSPKDRRKMILGMVEGLAQKLKEKPDDLQGWRRLARAYGVLGERQKAVEAYRRASLLAPKNARVLTDYALASLRVLPKGSVVPASLKSILLRLLEIEPKNPLALYYLGVAAEQDGVDVMARSYWRTLISVLPKNSPLLPQLRQRLIRLSVKKRNPAKSE